MPPKSKIDPICGMEGHIEHKGHYFCSKSCIDKYDKGVKWYQSETFAKVFPWVLGILLVGFFALSIIYDFMLTYMGIFFILFSLMKTLDWKGFAEAFAKYDIIAKRSKAYAMAYPAIEFLLGVAFLLQFQVIPAAYVTLFIMAVGGIGVGKNVFSKNQVKCACLGTKINVPLTKVTLLEDILMVIMAVMILFFGF